MRDLAKWVIKIHRWIFLTQMMTTQGSECIKPFANDEGVIDKAFRLFYVSTISSLADRFSVPILY
jgi:hypothetical protein